ncbi:MAG: thiopurine S-methyltransferase [Steroidobacteraceae bacterium]
MHPDFWHERWSSNQIGFHESAANPLLVEHFAALGLSPGARVFVPLCGKTLDIDWLLAQGHRVVAAELSQLAVAEVFARLDLAPEVDDAGELARLRAADLEVFVGDFFGLSAAALGEVDAVYDRAAMIALPAEMRRRYVAHMRTLVGAAPQLLVTLDYEQDCIAGPPFAVSSDEVRQYHGGRAPRLLAHHAVAGGLKGRCPATENVWLIPTVS